MGNKYVIAAWGLAALTACLTPFQALAGSPEFAYSEEKWAALRDNKLEYEEIGDLIHEYNSTVLQNQIDYKEYREKDRDDIAQSYYDAAEDIYSSIEYPDSDDSGYAGRLSAALSSELQADKLMEQGDNNVSDSEVVKLGYDQTEMELVKSAQTLMINYWTQYYNLEKLKTSQELSELQYQSAETKLAAGMSTQAALLTAKEAVTSAKASILSAESSLNQSKQNLCIMTGWSYGADVEIGEVPVPDLSAIEAIDLEADTKTALENNYGLKITRKKLANAQKTSTKENLEESLKSQERSAKSSVKNAYQNLLLARSDYDQTLQAYELEKKNMETADRQIIAGTITPNAYQQQKASFSTAEISVKTSSLALSQAVLNYNWAVNGLASVS
ncbi:TolC family protein [Clostridium sp. MCC353]|uniref:TolC family protein n=1 Tax=Clostridium sp. MCC353 TaxID=2592646 RepID=UPI001C0174B0|nr:TolC family protein [Clostridium sp. MCC353]MBT9777533.1 TolC family protein [Clostridium sp. MCC353]